MRIQRALIRFGGAWREQRHRRLLAVAVGLALDMSARSDTVTLQVNVNPSGCSWAQVTSLAGSDPAYVSPQRVEGSGAFDVPIRRGVPVLVCAAAADRATQCRTLLPEADEAVDFALSEGRRLEGYCRIGQTPAVGARLFLSLPDLESRRPVMLPLGRTNSGVVSSTVVNEDGRFLIEHVAAGEYVIEAHLPDGQIYSSSRFVVPERAPRAGLQTTRRDIDIDRGLEVRVAVLSPEGLPIEKAGVGTLQRPEGEPPVLVESYTGSDGLVRLAGLRDGPLKLTCVASGYARTELSFESLPVEAICTLERLARIRGVVRGESHAPIRDAVVSLGERTSVRSDRDGGVEIGGLKPDSYVVRVTAPGYTVFSRDIELQSGQEFDLGTVELRRGEGVHGRVVDGESGTGVLGSMVAVVGGGAQTLSGEDGRFSVIADRSSSVVLRVTARDYAEVDFPVPIGTDREVVIPLAAPGTLEVTVWREKGDACGGCTIVASRGEVVVSGLTDASGFVRFTGIAPGDYHVVRERVEAGAAYVTVSGGSVLRVATVRPRQTTRVQIGAPAKLIRVRLTPLPGPEWQVAIATPTAVTTVSRDARGIFEVKRREGEPATIRLVAGDRGVTVGTIPADYAGEEYTLVLGSSGLRFSLRQHTARTHVTVKSSSTGQPVAWGSVAATAIDFPYLPAGFYAIDVESRPVRTNVALQPSRITDLGAIDIFPQLKAREFRHCEECPIMLQREGGVP